MAMLPVSGTATQPGGLPAPTPVAAGPGWRSDALGRLVRAVRSNRKATVGTILLVIFILLALFPGVIAHKSPTATIYPRSLGPSAQHLLGTTAYGQDMWAQLI